MAEYSNSQNEGKDTTNLFSNANRHAEILDGVLPNWRSKLPIVYNYLIQRQKHHTTGDDSFGVVFAVTRYCNLLCKHCAVSAPHRTAILPSTVSELTTDDVYCIIDKVRHYVDGKGLPVFFMFGGGEPSLREDFEQIIEHAGETFGKANSGFCTNGSFRDSETILSAAKHVKLLEVSLDGFENYHNAWRSPGRIKGLPNAYRKTLDLMKAAAASLPDALEVTSVLTRANREILPDFARMLRDEIGVRNYSVHRPIPVGRMALHEDMLPSAQMYYDFLADMAQVSTECSDFHLHVHHSLESIYSTLFLGHDIHWSDLPMSSRRHSIGVCWHGNVHFDPWALVPPFACLSAGSLLKRGHQLCDFWDGSNSILSLIAEAKKANVRCRGCAEKCTGGMRLAAMMSELRERRTVDEVSPAELMGAVSGCDPACPLASPYQARQ